MIISYYLCYIGICKLELSPMVSAAWWSKYTYFVFVELAISVAHSPINKVCSHWLSQFGFRLQNLACLV